MSRQLHCRPAFAGLIALAAMSLGACRLDKSSVAADPQRRCHADHRQSQWVAFDDRPGAHRRIIAIMTEFARANRMDHESNDYPRGVPGNLHPQFLMSVCNAHFYALADNRDRGSVSVKILSDRLESESGADPLAVSLAARLKDEFKDTDVSSGISEKFRLARGDVATRDEAVDIASRQMSLDFPEVDVSSLKVTATESEKAWRVVFVAPGGSAAGPVTIDIDKRSRTSSLSSITILRGGDRASRLARR